MSADKNVVHFQALEFPPIEYGVTEAALKELAERYRDPDASTDDGYEACKDGCRELTSLRTDIETRRKDLKAPALDWGRQVDRIAKDLTRRIKQIESPVRAEKERVDAIKQALARAKVEAEQARIDGIKQKIAQLEVREQNPNDAAADYQTRITFLRELAIAEETFGEFVEDAEKARDASLYKLTQWHEHAVKREEDDAKREAERAEIAKQRAELDAMQAKQREEAERIAREKREAADRKAAEEGKKQQAEGERVAAIKARIDELRETPTRVMGADSHVIRHTINTLNEMVVTDFAEFKGQALAVHGEVMAQLHDMMQAAVDREEQAKRDEQARLPDKEKLVRWHIALTEVEAPKVLNDKAQKILRRYDTDLAKLLDGLWSAIEKL